MKQTSTQASRLGSVVLAFMLVLSLFFVTSAVSATAATTTNDQLAVLRVDFVSQQPDPVQPGSYVDLRWRVTNAGGKAADYVFALQPEFPFSMDNANDQTVSQASLTSYQATDDGAILFYRVRVARNAVEGSLNKIKLSYYKIGSSGSSVLLEQPLRIESQQGLVNINDVLVSPKQATIGSVFNVSLNVENFGTNFINNVKVSLNSVGSGLVPFGGSNQQTQDTIAGRETKTFTFQYIVDPSSKIQIVSIPVTVTYLDSLGRENTVSTTIGVQVGADSSYFPNLDRSDVFMANTQGKVVASISNTGKSDINFAILELVETNDYVVVGPATSYLGNLKSDDLQTGQFTIFVKPTTAASVPLTFKLTYKDAYDQKKVEEFTLNNRLYDAALAKKVGLLPATSYGGLIFFVLLVVIGGGYFWYRRGKNKAAAKNSRA